MVSTTRENEMSSDNRIAALERRHHDLESEIKSEASRPAGDDIHVGELKRRKLAIKDELQKLHAA
jgi:hypothetical protein